MTKVRHAMLGAVAILTSFVVTPPAHAGSVSGVLISSIIVSSTTTGGGTPIAVVNFPGGVSSPASCATIPQIGMAIDVSTAKGKAVLSTATAAFLAGKKVTVSGTGNSCVGSGFLYEQIQSILVVQ